MNPNTHQAVVTEVFGHIAPLILVVPYLAGLEARRVNYTFGKRWLALFAQCKKWFILDMSALDQSRRMIE